MRTSWRITEVRHKALFIVSGIVTSAALLFVVRTWIFPGNSWLYLVLALLVNMGFNLAGVRIFRGYREPVAPPRLWWRWTGRPKAGFWLGSIQVLVTLTALQELWPQHGHRPDPLAAILNIVSNAVIAFGYLNSSFRLRRHPDLWSERRAKA